MGEASAFCFEVFEQIYMGSYQISIRVVTISKIGRIYVVKDGIEESMFVQRLRETKAQAKREKGTCLFCEKEAELNPSL